jgi:hypothetical protein
MSRFLVAMFVGATIVAAVSTSASAYHCLARAPNGASATAFGVFLSRAQSIALRRCIHRGGGAGCQIVSAATLARRFSDESTGEG